jgi:NAD(P)-dependent dehydrogenase (short-subunit alcohol dehydrogenase family)
MSYTLVCTGCSSGLGLRALSLLLDSLTPSSSSTSQLRIFAGHRSPLSGRQVELTELAETKSVVVQWLNLDLTSFDSVRIFAAQVRKQATSIDCLLLNAAVWTSGEPRVLSLTSGQQWTEEAIVNHFCAFLLSFISHRSLPTPLAAHYYLSLLLVPLLQQRSTSSTSANPTTSQSRPRIVHTTSTLVSSIPSIGTRTSLSSFPTSRVFL